ncbi:MAG: long-chain fatty acid--CoA ligase, partial [Ilumatobacteraceae bacterium]
MLDMVESGCGDRPLLGTGDELLTGADLARLARAGGTTLTGHGALVYVGESHPHLPVALFAAASAGVPYVPINYRLEDGQLLDLIGNQPEALVLTDAATAPRLADLERSDGQGAGVVVRTFDDWLAALPDDPEPLEPRWDDDEVAVVLYTSGTTSAPKAALLRHRHLMAYLLGSVEFASASPDDTVLVAVPPYHVAGVANLLSNLFAGRRLVFMRNFEPGAWLDTVRTEHVTNAMVVPTMLARIVAALDGAPSDTPSLRTLSYGGSKVSERVLREAIEAFPTTGFVNAYGLTETASTIAVLGPDDHRAAMSSDDPAIQARLSSAGKVLPSIEVEVRDELDQPLAVGETGMLFLRGEQISGEYATGSLLDDAGWFCTRDHGWVDADGYLFIEGRADDTIIRGGENIAPAEFEEVLLAHPAVEEACVVGIPDDEWGQRVEAAVVLRAGTSTSADELREAVRAALRADHVHRWWEQPDPAQ